MKWYWLEIALVVAKHSLLFFAQYLQQHSVGLLHHMHYEYRSGLKHQALGSMQDQVPIQSDIDWTVCTTSQSGVVQINFAMPD